MIYVLFVLLLALDVVAYIASNRDILSPWVIVCGMFTISTFFAMINVNRWDFTFEAWTVFVILSALCTFGIGALIMQNQLQKASLLYSSNHVEPPPRIEIRTREVLLLIAVLTLMFIFYFYKTYQLSLANGNPGGLTNMVKSVNNAKLGFQRIGRPAEQMQVFTQCAAYICLFAFLRNSIFYRFQIRWILLIIPTIFHVAIEAFGGGRVSFIYLVVFILLIGFMNYMQKTKWNYLNIFKVIPIALLGLCAFLVVFLFAGSLKKSGAGMDTFNYVSLYMGSSIPALDEFLCNPRPETGYIGDHTLFSVYSVLRVLGFDLPQLYAPYDVISFTGISTNVYTALRRYIQDYTYVGMYFIMLFLGMLYSAFYNKVKHGRNFGFLLICYATFCFPLFEISIEERFLMSIVGTTVVYQLTYLGLLYYLFVVRREQQETNTLEQ